MTGRGHKLIAVALSVAVYKFTHDMNLTGFLSVIGLLSGATAPDWLEIRVRTNNGTRTIIEHRTITHWLVLWLALFGVTFTSLTGDFILPFDVPHAALELLLGFSMGGLLHLLTDVPNPMGIPVFTPFAKHRVSLNLWKSGKNEILMIIGAAIFSLLYIDIISFLN